MRWIKNEVIGLDVLQLSKKSMHSSASQMCPNAHYKTFMMTRKGSIACSRLLERRAKESARGRKRGGSASL